MVRLLLGCLVAIVAFPLDVEAGSRRRRAVSNYSQSESHTTSAFSYSDSNGSFSSSFESHSSSDALSQVNSQRAARGLPAFIRDEGLMQGAFAAAQHRAQRRLFGHTNNDFSFLPAGAHASAAGCAAYPASYGFMACATYERYRFAGAASVMGADGKMYHHLFVRN